MAVRHHTRRCVFAHRSTHGGVCSPTACRRAACDEASHIWDFISTITVVRSATHVSVLRVRAALTLVRRGRERVRRVLTLNMNPKTLTSNPIP